MTAWTEDTSLGRKREPSVGEKRRPLASPLDCPVTVLLGSLPAHLCPRLPCPGLSPIQTAVSSWVHPFLCHLPSTADPESPSPQEDTREVILRFIVPLAPLPLQLHKTAQFPPGKGPWGLADSSPSSSCKERRPSDLAKVLQQVRGPARTTLGLCAASHPLTRPPWNLAFSSCTQLPCRLLHDVRLEWFCRPQQRSAKVNGKKTQPSTKSRVMPVWGTKDEGMEAQQVV
ncbi:uncharacterized protein LOC125127316 isoform X2 [Phacochoerus africanus]|uniref:uncharacterized protein LOC125127316 isoform X2 n=1 Tax=Phacochoerus africanus TaxID=41426 RepID=UPI001FD8B1F0|nr:uncharacterized protein LOC125127316 isoform X2 [Phacochoerus africanus]